MKKSKLFAVILTLVLMVSALCLTSVSVFAETNTAETAAVTEAEEIKAPENDAKGEKAIAAAIVVGIASALGAVGMGIAIAKAAESLARQPEASGKINSAMMLGLVFIETLIIYALIVAILIIFVL